MRAQPEVTVRVAEVVGALSLATDLGTGVPQERALRACLLAVRFGELIGLDQQALERIYYLCQLAMLGCTADGPTSAAVFGDEIAIGPRLAPLMFGPQREMALWIVRNFGAEQAPLERARSIVRLMSYGGGGGMSQASTAHCEVAQRLAARLGLDETVFDALGYTFERWDGSGARRIKGEAIPMAVRIGHLAWDVEIGERMGGVEACGELTRRHAGAGLDPGLVERFCHVAPEALAAVDVSSAWEAALAAEPGPTRVLADDQVDTAASIFADFTDLKSAFTSEHSRRVGALAADAAQRRGMDSAMIDLVRRAGLVHDLGRVALSAGVWDRAGPLPRL
jgi:hypothetical protein